MPWHGSFQAFGKSRAGDVAIQVKVLPTLKLEDLQGRLAHAVLVAQGRPELVHLVVMVVPRVTPAAVETAQALFAEHAPAMQWMLVGEAGDEHVRAPALGVPVREVRRPVQRKVPPPTTTAGLLFSDKNAWMLKVLLLREAPARLWGGPRAVVHTALELARVANVSTPHAHRFVRAATDMNLLRKTDDGLRIVRAGALVDQWFEAQRLAPRQVVPVRWILGRPDDLRAVFATSSARDDEGAFAIAGFDACAAMGILHTNATHHEVHIKGDVDSVCRRFDLEVCDTRDAHFSLLPTRGVSVFRGALEHRGLPHVDALQAALDVVVHAARGREQAAFITADVLGFAP